LGHTEVFRCCEAEKRCHDTSSDNEEANRRQAPTIRLLSLLFGMALVVAGQTDVADQVYDLLGLGELRWSASTNPLPSEASATRLVSASAFASASMS